MPTIRRCVVLPLFNISRNIDFQPGFLKSGLTKINFDNGFEFLRSFSWFAIVLVLALKWLLPGEILVQSLKTCFVYYRGIYSAKHLQILQNVGWFSVSISSGNVQIFVLNVTFTRYMMKVSCGNTEFKHPNQNKIFQDSQGRAALFASPFLQNLKYKFPQ